MNTTFIPFLNSNQYYKYINFYGISLPDIVDVIEEKVKEIVPLQNLGLNKNDILEYFYLKDQMNELDGKYNRKDENCYQLCLKDVDTIESLITTLKAELNVLYDYIEEHSVDARGDDYNLSTSEYVKNKRTKEHKQYIQQKINELFLKNQKKE